MWRAAHGVVSDGCRPILPALIISTLSEQCQRLTLIAEHFGINRGFFSQTLGQGKEAFNFNKFCKPVIKCQDTIKIISWFYLSYPCRESEELC